MTYALPGVGTRAPLLLRRRKCSLRCRTTHSGVRPSIHSSVRPTLAATASPYIALLLPVTLTAASECE